MPGGERERKGKKVEPRFRDKKRPRLTKDEKKSLALKNEGFGMLLSDGSKVFKFCPKDGKKLEGRSFKCPSCLEKWAGKFVSESRASVNAHLVDSRDFLKFWRQKVYWRLTFTEHKDVEFTTDPPTPLSVFEHIFSDDYEEAAWKTSVITHVRLLETTRAVEEFLGFSEANDKMGYLSCKLFPSGELVMVVPPIRVVHVESEKSGSKVSITFGWISMTARGLINLADNMEEPAQGWEFVQARFWDLAENMQEVEYAVDAKMVEQSEAILMESYGLDKEAFLAARNARSMVDEHYIMPRPNTLALHVARKPYRHAKMEEDEGYYDPARNPYLKRPDPEGKGITLFD
jgi:hypothetical protein